MKAMPLPFKEFQGKGILDLDLDLDFSSSSCCSSDSLSQNHNHKKWSKEICYVGSEPTSVLDTKRSPSPPTSSSTLSSSFGGGGGGGGSGGCQAGLDIGGKGVCVAMEKCGLGMEDWESVLSESGGGSSPNHEQSILRMIMGENDDQSPGFNKFLQSANGSQSNLEFNGGFGMMDQGFGFEGNLVSNIDSSFSDLGNLISVSNPLFSSSGTNLLPVSFSSVVDEKPQLFNQQMVINQNQAQFHQNPAFFLQLPHAQIQEHHLLSPPPSKRLNSGGIGANQAPKVAFLDSGQEWQNQHLQLHPHLQQRPTMGMKQKTVSASGDELANHQLQQGIIDQLFKLAELIESGNTVLAQGILARLNHQLFPIGKPIQRAAFYFKEALQLLLPMNTTNPSGLSPFSLIFKIGAYKSFSEVSPILQFANFTCNQALLEALDGFDKVHILDFDVGYGEQWASLIQELALRNGGAPSLKITAFASPSTHDELELGFAQENLKLFASDINMKFEFEVVSFESLNSASLPLPIHISEDEAIAVNLPISSFSNYPLSLPLVLRFVKQLSPKIVISLDRGCDRPDVPFPHHIIHAFQSYSTLLESIDAVNINPDALQKIERFLLQPVIEKIVLGRYRSPERMSPWRSIFLSSGFNPMTFSNITESQAECLVQRTPVRGFHVEKRQSSLVLCWQRRELISVSAWRC